MTIKNRDGYVKYRFEKALESFDDAIILAEKGKWNTVINRLYYSCFYAVISLLIKNNINTTTHDGTRSKFGIYYVKTGRIDKKYGKLYTKLFDMRQKGDYGDLFDYDKETVLPLIDSTRDFINEIRKLLK